MLTLRRYWSTVQNQLNEKECYDPDQFEFWLYTHKYAKDFLAVRQECFDRLHSFPGSDDIAIAYMDIGDCLGVAYLTQKLIIINPFQLLAMPVFTIRYIIPHEYVHIMLAELEDNHGPTFQQYFEAVVGEKHPDINHTLSRAGCKYYLETKRGRHAEISTT